jgi:glycerol-3-phosphate cytidylyltransferase
MGKESTLVGYTTGVFDLFHIGHLNLLRRAREACDKLIVGVTSDELVRYKHKNSVIPFEERIKIVKAIRFVDEVVTQSTMDKFEAWERIGFNVMFVGSDWQGHERWIEYEKQFSKVGVGIVYLPYTEGTSSTLINETLLNLRDSGD